MPQTLPAHPVDLPVGQQFQLEIMVATAPLVLAWGQQAGGQVGVAVLAPAVTQPILLTLTWRPQLPA